jgi:hypothetical protein
MDVGRRAALPLIVAAAVVAVGVIGAVSGGQVHSVPSGPATPGAHRPLPTAAPSPAPTMAPLTAPPGLTGATRVLLLVLGIALARLVLFVLFLIGRFVWRRRHLFRLPGRPEPDDWDDQQRAAQATEAARTAVDEGIAELDVAGSDPRLVVIGCWVRLERAAARAGTERAPSDTPADLVNRMLAGRQVSAGTLANLADLYRAARYGQHDIGERMRDEALAALTALADELARPAAETAAAAAAGRAPAENEPAEHGGGA